MNYKYQLLCYAYIYTKQGVDIDRIRLVYVNRPIAGGISEKTGKPLKIVMLQRLQYLQSLLLKKI